MMENVASFIERCWEEFGGDQSKSIDEWYEFAGDTLPEEHGKAFNAWLSIYDQFLSWIISYNFLAYFVLAKKQEPTSLQNCQMMIGATVISLSISLRRLALDGHDVPARHVMRCLQEYVDILALLSVRPDLCEEFKETQDEVSANAFWHKYVSKGKAQREITNHRKAMVDEKAIDEMNEWKRQEGMSMAMASHPSYASGLAILFSHSHDDPNANIVNPLYPLGVKTSACLRPLRNGVFALFDHLLDCPLSSIDENCLDHEFIKPILEHTRNGIEVLFHLILYAVQNQDNDELRF